MNTTISLKSAKHIPNISNYISRQNTLTSIMSKAKENNCLTKITTLPFFINDLQKLVGTIYPAGT